MEPLRLYVPPDPRPTSHPGKRRSTIKSLSLEQEERTLQFAADVVERHRRGAKTMRAPCLAKVTAAERDLFVIRLGLTSGLRLDELCEVDVTDVYLSERKLHVRHGKGDKERWLPIPTFMVPVIRDWIGNRTSGPLITDDHGRRLKNGTVYMRLRRLGERLKIVLHPHMLRHTYATRLLETGSTLKEVQDLLGHEDISVTARYLHVTPARMQSAVDRLSLTGLKS